MIGSQTVVAPLSRDAIETFALAWRRALGFDDAQPVDMLKIIEFILPMIWDDYTYEIVDDAELGEAEATTSTTNRHIRIGLGPYERAMHGISRYAFTLAHELGHLLLHTGKPTSLARGTVKPFLNPEWQADTFAGAFLVPAGEARKCLSVEEIAARFRISQAAAQVRADVLKIPGLSKKKGH